jgi:hypothetical protein
VLFKGIAGLLPCAATLQMQQYVCPPAARLACPGALQQHRARAHVKECWCCQ